MKSGFDIANSSQVLKSMLYDILPKKKINGDISYQLAFISISERALR